MKAGFKRCYDGPADDFPKALTALSDGVWLTSGRTAIVETGSCLTLIDPGDERWLETGNPVGPLAEIISVASGVGKKVRRVLVTHAHQDHVANLPTLLAMAGRDGFGAKIEVLASIHSPLENVTRIDRETALDDLSGFSAIPLKGHSPWGDDLAFFLPDAKILFSGDIAQPKGESWEEAFYPSPWPWFIDGGVYLDSLDRLLALDFSTLVTGHREVRPPPRGREWIALTRRAIARVGEEVASWTGGNDPVGAGRAIFKKLAAERGIDDATVAGRMSPPGTSVFDQYDMTGVRYFWGRIK